MRWQNSKINREMAFERTIGQSHHPLQLSFVLHSDSIEHFFDDDLIAKQSVKEFLKLDSYID